MRSVLLAVLFILFGTFPLAAAPITVSGQVVSKATGTPVADTLIILLPADAGAAPTLGRPPSDHTAADGRFQVEVPVPGQYHLSVYNSNYANYTQNLAIPETGVAGLSIALVSPAVVRVQVLGPDGAPVTTGTIYYRLLLASTHAGDRASATWGIITASKDGPIELPAMRALDPPDAGAVGVMVRDSGLGVGTAFSANLPKGALTVRLNRGVILSGTVVGDEGKPQPDVEVRAHGEDADPGTRFLEGAARTKTGADGRFELRALLPGRYNLTSHLPDHRYFNHLVAAQTDQTGIVLSPRDFTELYPWGQPVPPSSLMIGFPDWDDAGEYALSLPWPPGPQHPALISIQGKVLKKTSGSPAARYPLAILHRVPVLMGRQVVEATSAESCDDAVVTGPDGAFTLQVSRPGSYYLESMGDRNSVYAAGFYKPLDVPAGGIANLTLSVPTESWLTLRLTGPDGAPAPPGEANASVQASIPGEPGYGWIPMAHVGEDGKVSLLLNDYGHWDPDKATSLTVEIRDQQAGYVAVHLDRWPDSVVPVRLQTGSALSGTITDLEGRPAPGARVTIYHLFDTEKYSGFKQVEEATADGQGRFQMDALEGGSYLLQVSGGGLVGTTRLVQIPQDVSARFRLKRGESMTVQVVDAAGQPVSRASLMVFLLRQDWQFPSSNQVFRGYSTPAPLVVDSLVPGTYYLAASDQHGGFASRLVTLGAGQRPQVVLQIAPTVSTIAQETASVAVTTLDPRGQPAKVFVVASRLLTDQPFPNSKDAFRGNSQQGQTTIDHLAPGSYYISAIDDQAEFASCIVALSPGQNPPLTLHLAPGRIITLHVVDRVGQPVQGARFTVLRLASATPGSLFYPSNNYDATNQTGDSVLHVPGDGIYLVDITVPGEPVRSVLVQLHGADRAMTVKPGDRL